jgi:transposase
MSAANIRACEFALYVKGCHAVGVRRIAPNFENCTFGEMQAAEKNAASKRAARRIMALRLLFQGRDYDDVLAIMDCSSRTLARWIARFNDYGIDGLTHDVERPGRPTKIPPDKHEAFKELLRQPYQIGRDFWTARVLHGYLAKEWQIEMGYSTVCARMHAANFDLKSARPWPGMRQDPVKRAAYLEDLKRLQEDPTLDLWYGDETGIEGDPKPRRRWAEKGVKTTVPYTGDHIRENVIGAVCPQSGELFCHVVPWVDSEWFGLFLKGLADVTRERHQAGRRIVLILDNASWHKVQSLPKAHIEIRYLPAYSPDFNPIEHVWLVLKTWWFNNHHCNTHEELAARVDRGLRCFFDSPEIVRSICGKT